MKQAIDGRLLLSCFEAPGWGGAATVCYLLFERLQSDGHDVAYLNLVRSSDDAFLRDRFGENYGNPRSLDGVHTHVLSGSCWDEQPELQKLVGSLGCAHLFGLGYIAAHLLRRADRSAPLLFMTAGCTQTNRLLAEGVIDDYMSFQKRIEEGASFPVVDEREREIVVASDRIISHSPLNDFSLRYFFPESADKVDARMVSVADLVHWEAEPYHKDARKFEERDIDLMCIASNWARPVKNYGLVEQLAHRCSDLRVHLVGQVEDRTLPVVYHGIVTDRNELFGLLGRTKTIACPSRMDAAPGVLFEAVEMGCNVVASRNCGNWQLCHAELLAEQCDVDHFEPCVRRSLARPYTDNRDLFAGGYANLLEILGGSA